jgi:hypothetical protein
MSELSSDKRSQYIGTHVFHIFVIAPLLYYVGATKEKTSENYIYLLMSIFALAFFYHGFMLSKKFNYISSGHVIMAVVGIYFLMNKPTPELFYIVLMLLSFYVAFKHAYMLMQIY